MRSSNDFEQLLDELYRDCVGLHPAADATAIASIRDAARRAGGALPEQVLSLYARHDGSAKRPVRNGRMPPVRLMPVDEAVRCSADLNDVLASRAAPGRIFWLWADDQSNYVGVFLDGELRGWLTVLSHDEPEATPAFRSVSSFLTCLIHHAEDDQVVDAPLIPRELPTVADDPCTLENDRRLAQYFLARYRAESDEDARRTWAQTFLCLLPVADTDAALELLDDRDMWTPESAVCLIELRDFREAIPALRRLALEGGTNGYGAAMRALARFGSPESRRALDNVQAILEQKLETVRSWKGKRPPLPPRW
jgi:hypothetical protein